MQKMQLPSFATFGEMLRYLRRRAHLTQRELSIATGYSESQISRLEQDERLPNATTLLAVFVPALHLEMEPQSIERLLALASAARVPIMEAESSASSHGNDESPLKSNLSPRLTNLIGREAALNELHKLILTRRLVTLTGAGGVGKSSLSQVVGAKLLDHFVDGVWYIELAAMADPTLLPQSIATHFRLPEQPARTPLDLLTTYFRQKELLLILDNCEHLIDGCAHLVTHLRHTCPHLHILATSRESLRVLDEIEWPVPPLDVPQLDVGESFDADRALQAYSALGLFRERARAVKPDFELDDRSATQVAHICTKLDGLPLAIELAAARVRGMTVSELAARINDRFQLLSNGARSAPTRHQTLRAAIDWSYNLLSAQERALLRRCTVFNGGWTLDAIEAIADSEADALANPIELLLQLINKSLVVAETRGSTTRYRLLETIRQYASEKLHEAGESEEIQSCHFDYFLQMAEAWHDVTMVGQHYMLWLDRLEMEMGNLRAAYAWSRRLQDIDARALRLAGALWPFWFNRGRLAEGLRWIEEALTEAPYAPTQVRATALVGIATLKWYVLEPVQVVALAEEAVRLCRQAGDQMGMAHAYFILAESTKCLSNFDLAEEYYIQAMELFRKVNWLPGVGRCLAFWITVRVQSGGVDQAISSYEECLAIGQQVDDHSVSACALEGLLSVDRQRGKELYQQELVRRRAKMAAAPSDSRYEVEALAGLLQSYGRQVHFSGEPEDVVESIAALEECLFLWKRLGILWSAIGGTARAHFDLGIPLLLMNQYAESIATEEEAVRLYTEVGDWQGVVWAQTKVGWSALGLRNFTLAQNSFCASLRYAPDGSIGYAPLALAGMAELARQQGDITRAGRLYSAAMRFEIQEEPLSALPAIKAIHSYLDDPHFAAAWAEGTAMTLPQAIAYALS